MVTHRGARTESSSGNLSPLTSHLSPLTPEIPLTPHLLPLITCCARFDRFLADRRLLLNVLFYGLKGLIGRRHFRVYCLIPPLTPFLRRY